MTRFSLPQGPFSVIYADPPWRFETWSEEGKDRAPDQHYSTMPIEEICALPVSEISAKDAALFLWIYQPMIPHALRLIESWGFRFKTVAYYWVKIKGGQDRLFYSGEDVRNGLGYHTRAGAEQVWLATRGKGYDRLSKSESQVVFSPLREHSRKPEEVPESIVRLCGDVPRVELFGRTSRPGWTVWGDQAQLFDQGEPA